MAESILTANTPYLHINGSYHSNVYQGIVWYLLQTKPKAEIMTICVVEQEDINELQAENLGLADFIIVVDDDMTKSY